MNRLGVVRGLKIPEPERITGLDEFGGVLMRIGDHEMHVQRNLRDFANRFDHFRSDRDIGDKVAIHDIHMEPIGAGPFNGPDIIFQKAESVDRIDGAIESMSLSEPFAFELRKNHLYHAGEVGS